MRQKLWVVAQAIAICSVALAIAVAMWFPMRRGGNSILFSAIAVTFIGIIEALTIYQFVYLGWRWWTIERPAERERAKRRNSK